MRSNIADYNAVVEAASKFTRSVAEGNSKYAKELFTEDACLFGFLNGKFERGRCAAGSTSRNSLNHTSNDWTAAMVRVMRSSRVQPSWSTLLFDPTPLEVSCADMQG